MSIIRDPLLRWQHVDCPYYRASYQYDNVGNLTNCQLNDALGNSHLFYQYDDLDQLTTESNFSYAHDSIGNRLQKNGLNYTVNKLCQITDDGAQNYQYDTNGNLIACGNYQFTYDSQDRLIRVCIDNQTIHYTYDPFHRRLNKDQDRYIWDGNNEIGIDQKQLRILGVGQGAEIGAAVLYELDQTYIPIHDQRGCLVSLITPDTVEVYRYSAFGEQLTPSCTSPWGFCSKRFDDETQLTYFGRRYYSANLGRFVTPDPQGFLDGPNLYAYCHNSPLLNIDLYGLWTFGGFFKDAFATCFPFTHDAIYSGNVPQWQKGLLIGAAAFEIISTIAPPLKGATMAAGHSYRAARLVNTMQRTKVVQTAEKAAMEAVSKRVGNVAAKEGITRQSIAIEDLAKKGFPSLDKLSEAGKVMDRAGLTRAGRALDKHGGRLNSAFPKATGNSASKNMQGQFHLDDVLTNPEGFLKTNKFNGLDFYKPDGSGVRFYQDGSFRGFLEPNL